MALNQTQQLHEALHRANSVLVICRAQATTDEFVTAAALGEFLKSINKQVEVVVENFQAPTNLKFLPELTKIKPAIGQLHEFMVKLNVGEQGLESFRYDIADNELTVYLTPKNGIFTPEMIRTASSDFRFDLIVAIGAPDLNSLGSIFTTNSALFHNTPIINIDHSPTNEFFGHINYVDISLTSCAETLYSILTITDTKEITPNIANLILTGMIAATRSFKTQNVNARTLQTASTLMGLGADRENIVHNLYRQRSIAALKLWGAALTNLQSDPQLPLLWSTLTREDFARAGAAEKDLQELIDELISTSPQAKVFALIYENPATPEKLCAIVDAQKPYTAAPLTNGFVGAINSGRRTEFCLENISLAEAAQKISNVLRAKMRA